MSISASDQITVSSESTQTVVLVRDGGGTDTRDSHLRYSGRRMVNREARAKRAAESKQRAKSLVARRMAAGEAFVEPQGNLSRGYAISKRLLDIAGAIGVLVVLSPVMLAVFVVLMVTTRGKPLFWQMRSGYLGRPFKMYKFRTMRPDADSIQDEVENEQEGPIFKNRRDPRITRLGQFLRKTSIDETPQLFSVLLGHMSLVGPRPLPVHETAEFEAWHRARLTVMPGLTCLWQVSGRSEIGFKEWMRMDIRYMRDQNLKNDLKLLVKTPITVITGRGAY